MKKKQSGTHRSAGKSRGAAKTVDEYFAGIKKPAYSTLSKMRVAIRSAVPQEAVEIISYGIPAFKHDRILVWFAAFSDHCSLFPTAEVIDAFKEELKGFSISKGTIHFPIDKPLPIALIKKMVKARVEKDKSKKRR